jgi:transmembrane sensor
VNLDKDGSTGKEELVEQAAKWMACITDPDASASEFRDWQEWLNASPAHAAAYQEIESIWALTGHAEQRGVEAPESAAPESAPLPQFSQSRRVRRRRALVFASAACAAALAIGISLWLVPEKHDKYVFETATAEQRSVRLADGSHLVVGAETKVSVDLTATRRSVTLDHSMAYFKVAPDKSRPFVVASEGYSARAVGTAFSVDVQPGRMFVLVTEGVVQVGRLTEGGQPAGNPSSRLVHAGQRASLDAAGVSCLRVPSSFGAIPAWINGRLEYLHEELSFVIADVNRYSQRKIVLNDAEIGHRLYTGTVLLEHVDEWVATLPGSFPVRLDTANADRFVLYAAGESSLDRDDHSEPDGQRLGSEAGC